MFFENLKELIFITVPIGSLLLALGLAYSSAHDKASYTGGFAGSTAVDIMATIFIVLGVVIIFLSAIACTLVMLFR